MDSQKREISSVVAQLGEEVSVKKQELKNATTEKELAEEATQKANEERITAQQEKEVLLTGNKDLRMENSRLESHKNRLRMENHDLKKSSYSCRQIMKNWNNGMKIYNIRIVN